MEHRVLMIGHGGIAHTYMRILSTLPNVRVCGIVGRNIERAEHFAKQYQVPYAGTNVNDLANLSSATAAIVCTPNATHHEGVLAAARAGLHCLCEKPLHIDPLIQNKMIAACKAQGLVLTVSYMRRFSAHFQWLDSVIQSRELGRITVADVQIKHFRSPSYYEGTWHGTVSQDGGGPFIQQGSHIIDLVLWLCGGYHQVLQAKRFKVFHDIETEDHGYAVIQYGNGAIGMIQASTGCVGIGEERIELSGTKGSIIANYDGITAVHVPGLKVPDFASMTGGNEELMRKLLQDFFSAVESNSQPFITAHSASLTTELIREIYVSSGEPILTKR